MQRPALLISQAEIEGALRDRLATLGGAVEWGRTATDLHVEDGGVDVVVGDGETVRADWVIGCDGAHSRVRAAAGIGFPGVPLAEHFLLADVHDPCMRERRAGWSHPCTCAGSGLSVARSDVSPADGR